METTDYLRKYRIEQIHKSKTFKRKRLNSLIEWINKLSKDKKIVYHQNKIKKWRTKNREYYNTKQQIYNKRYRDSKAKHITNNHIQDIQV